MSDEGNKCSFLRYIRDNDDEYNCIKYEWVRLSKFGQFESSVSAIKLAKNGFYPLNCCEVACFFCKRILHFSSNIDNSRLHNITCSLVSGINCKNIPIREIAYIENVSVRSFIEGGSTTRLDDPASTSITASGVEGHNRTRDAGIVNGPKYPDYASETKRLLSFDGCTERERGRNKQLAKCGFFNAGLQSSARCHWCAFNLRYIVKGDPLELHVELFSTCEFLEEQRRLGFIGNQRELTIQSNSHVQEKDSTKKFTDDSNLQLNVMAKSDDQLQEQQRKNHNDHGARPKELVSTNLASNKTIQCHYCEEATAEVVFLPCKHLVSCAHCATDTTICVMCRSEVKENLKIYPS